MLCNHCARLLRTVSEPVHCISRQQHATVCFGRKPIHHLDTQDLSSTMVL